jgi:hypothetical protein
VHHQAAAAHLPLRTASGVGLLEAFPLTRLQLPVEEGGLALLGGEVRPLAQLAVKLLQLQLLRRLFLLPRLLRPPLPFLHD